MKYVSKKKEQCLVMRPTDRIMDEHRRIQVIPGKRVEFFDGRYETQDPEIIEFLHNHPLRGTKFFEITEKDEQIVAQAKKSTVPRVVDGAVDSVNSVDGGVPTPQTDDVVLPTRPTDTVAVSPQLIKVIDERISAALGTIIDLLNKDTKKEEIIMAGKPTKVFTCPYCKEPQPSGFAIGKHKLVCEQRPIAA